MANTSLLATDPTLRAEHAYFSALPSCAPHLSAHGWTALPTRCRTVKPDNEDSLLSTTLQTSTTLPHVLTLARCPSVPVVTTPPPRGAPLTLGIPAVKTLYALGAGLDGFPLVLHGGLVATLLDETMGILLTTNEQHVVAAPDMPTATAVADPSSDLVSGDADARREDNRRAAQGGGTIDCVTASLNIRFKAPVRTPAEVVVVEAKVVRAEGRRLYLTAELSAEGKVCAVGEAVFVRVPTERL
jgi:acyl-coenzyme A thioesterase PaaI-like protein